jgi:hypothetical protein
MKKLHPIKLLSLLGVFLIMSACGESGQTASSDSEKNAEKAADIYVSFFKSYVSKEIPQEEKECLIGFLNEIDEGKFKSAGKPITNLENSITFEKFNEDVKSIEFYPNGNLASDFALVQPVAQVIEMISKNVCK